MRNASAICCVGGRSGVTADEHQPQDVVAIMRAIEPFGELVLGIVEIGDGAVVRQRLLLAGCA